MSVSNDMLGTPEIFFLGHLFSHCELLRRIEDSLRVDILAGLNRPKEFSLAERLLTGRCPVDPDKLDRPGDDPRPLDGINRTDSHVIIVAEHKLDFIPIIRKPLFHEGGGLVSLPVCDPACDLLDRNTAVLQSLDGPLRADQGILVVRLPLKEDIRNNPVPVPVKG